MNPLRHKTGRYIASAILLLAVCIAGYALHGLVRYLTYADNGAIGQFKDGYRVDREPILTRFPRLGPFEKCYWKADIIGRADPIGPTPYWMKGFVVLDSIEFEAFKAEYQWADVESGWEPSLDAAILGVQSFRWSHSREFDDYMKSTRYFARFYLDLENGIVFFDVEK